MQDEEDQLFHELQIHTVTTWTRWWCLTSRSLVLVFKKKAWGSDWWFPEARESLTSDRLAYCVTEDHLVPKRARA